MSTKKKKIYEGNLYKFTVGNSIGKGGNGEVFEANILKCENKEKYVVKFLFLDRWTKEKLIKRYDRFYKEINTVKNLQNDIEGIMEIVDFHCPHIMHPGEKVWYLMKKAETFNRFNKINKLNVKVKLQYLLELSNILCILHEKGYSHRDIKVDNLLISNNKLKLSDFGLRWNVDDSIITGERERIGPYYIY